MADDSILDAGFSHPIPDEAQVHIAARIWSRPSNTGPQAALSEVPTQLVRKLPTYFEYYSDKGSKCRSAEGFSALKTHRELLFFIDLLKENSSCPRRDLYQACLHLNHGDTAAASKIVTLPKSLLPPLFENRPSERNPLDVDAALIAAVRAMLAININPAASQQGYGIAIMQSNVVWEESQSLADLVEHNFPTRRGNSQSSTTSVRLTNVRARYLEDHMKIRIVWTRHFPDHLKLEIGTKEKTLKIFELASLLEVSYDVSCTQPFEQSVPNSLKLGCYPPALLYETLKTYELLFPTRDSLWLDGRINPKAPWFGLFGSQPPALDRRLSCQVEDFHKRQIDAEFVTSSYDLFEKYPYWARRIQDILEEVEDPTPISWFGKWSERRKSARHTFRLTYLALVAAILFGVAATVLAALSIWISYCNWQGPQVGKVCALKFGSNTSN